MRRQRFLLTVLLLSLGLTCGMLGYAFTNATGARPSSPLPSYGRLPDFSLMDHHDQPLSRATLAGSVWIADFIFTRCAGQCPLMSAQMARLSEALQDVPEVRFISFSVDPAHDTPERLADYASSYGAGGDRWRFVTEAPRAGEAGAMAGGGGSTSIARLARQGFRLGVSADGTEEEPITHSVRLVLIDQHGSIRGYYDATEAQAVAQLQADARRLARER
jgi:protein SCO1/2